MGWGGVKETLGQACYLVCHSVSTLERSIIELYSQYWAHKRLYSCFWQIRCAVSQLVSHYWHTFVIVQPALLPLLAMKISLSPLTTVNKFSIHFFFTSSCISFKDHKAVRLHKHIVYD